MSDVTLDQLVEAEQGTPIAPGGQVESFETVEQQPSRMGEMFQRLITAETGSGDIETYIEHPMNYNKSKGLAQILRGLTGIIGNLDLAIIDVVFGAFRFSKEKGGVPVVNTESEGVLFR
jgi:hypothetical protein